MDHRYIKEHNIADRYLMGKLSSWEQDKFEQHYIDCKKCVKLLEEIQVVRRTLRFAGLELPVGPDFSLRGWLGSLIPSLTPFQQASLMAALVLLLAAIPLVSLVNENRRLQRELDQTRDSYNSLSAELQNQDNVNRQDQPGRTDTPITEADTGKPDQSKPRREPAAEPGQDEYWPKQPQPNTPIFILSVARRAAEVPNELRINPLTRFFVISLDLGGEAKYQRYRAAILTGSNQARWQIGNLRPGEHGMLTISFNSKSFQDGDYLLALEGLSKEGKYEAVASYPFRVIKENVKKQK